ncbi:hypothetical protein HanIR_Chr04g0205081 [Helianthus annuus]|nr:hypothetical protein HanIR_Chr04g0205081 [Helianthus annuus]
MVKTSYLNWLDICLGNWVLKSAPRRRSQHLRVPEARFYHKAQEKRIFLGFLRSEARTLCILGVSMLSLCMKVLVNRFFGLYM